MRAPAIRAGAAEAVALIPDRATVAVGGFVGAGHPEALTAAVEDRFLRTGHPKNLTLLYAAGQGDRGHRGLNHFGHPGLVERIIGGHWNLAPALGNLVRNGHAEGYNLPQGVICQLLREIAARRPGVMTKVGLNTFIDPRLGGGKLSASSTQDWVRRISLDGEEWLWYRSFPVHVGLIRATSADSRGNLTFEREGLIGEALPIAQAARNHAGLVIAQVERLVERHPDPKAIRVPGILVDRVVVSPQGTHDQTFGECFNPTYAETNPGGRFMLAALPWSERTIIGRRALAEIRPGEIVNLGIGLPEAVAAEAAAAGRLHEFTLTVESGPIGGVPAGGLSFGCSQWPEAIIDQPAQFDFYDGGGLDIGVLGAAEIDREGNVNVASLGDRFAGVGGFINVAQSARRVVFCCSFTVGDLEVAWNGESLKIVREGRKMKFVERVAHICFDGRGAQSRGQQVTFVTERAVFGLTESGLELREVAPGIDPELALWPRMAFRPVVSASTRIMSPALFQP